MTAINKSHLLRASSPISGRTLPPRPSRAIPTLLPYSADIPKAMFTNPHSDKSFAVWVEPGARDFWLRAGEVIAIEFSESDRWEQMPGLPLPRTVWCSGGGQTKDTVL